MPELLTTRTAMLAATQRLTAQFPCCQPGSVIRCFAREVARARRSGAAHDTLVDVAEMRTRAALVRRGAVPGSAVAC